MRIIVVDGTKPCSLVVTPRHSVGDVKKMMENRTGIPPRCSVLLYNGKQLWDDHLTLGDHEIETDDTLHCVFRLLSCVKCPSRN